MLRITGVSVVVSVLIYSIIAYFADLSDEPVGYIMSVLVPSLVAPVATWITSGLYARIRRLNAQLEKANATIAASAERKERMFRRLSHELRTPAAALHTLAGAPHLVQQRGDSLREAADMMLEILDTLNLALTEGQDMPIGERKLPLTRLVADLTFLGEALAADRPTEFLIDNRLSNAQTQLIVSGDMLRLKSAVLNLIRNALLHAEAQRCQLQVSARDGPDGLLLQLRVDDDGKGIPTNEVERLFAHGERGDTHAPGSGLGMTIARDWIQDMGGALRHDPGPLGGAGFTIDVPLTLATPDRPVAPEPDVSQLALRHLSALVVDDDRLSRFINSEILRRHLGHVDVAGTCADALEAMEHCAYDLILVDHHLPDGTGTHIVSTARSRGLTGVALALTATDTPLLAASYAAAGADAVLIKPMPLDRVLESLRAGLTTDRYGSGYADDGAPGTDASLSRARAQR